MTAPWKSLAWLLPAAAVVAWSYWPTFDELARRWTHDPQYAHGYLVPPFAAALLGLRRDRLDEAALRPSCWGAAVVAAGAVVRYVAACLANDWLDAASLLPCLAGLCLLAGGWAALRWAWPAIAFLVFMIPLPNAVEITLAAPLQQLATSASAYALQTLGYAAIPEGNRIVIGKQVIEVIDTCNGLGMLMTFLTLATAVAIVTQRPAWERVALIASAAPIALLVNVIRIAGTGVLFDLFGSASVRAFAHDFAGWVMMPLALAMLGVELWVLPRLFLERKRAA